MLKRVSKQNPQPEPENEPETEHETGTDVAKPIGNVFQAYGQQAVARGGLIGAWLKYNKGDWIAEGQELPAGTKLVAVMASLQVGWVCWQGGEVVDEVWGTLSAGYVPPRRSELDEQDKANWETDDKGRAKDPWSFSNKIALADPTSKSLFTYTTNSRGGVRAVGRLCAAFPDKDQYPIVALGTDSYQHRDKSVGRVKEPTLEIVSWTPRKSYDALITGAAPRSIPAAKAPAQPSGDAAAFDVDEPIEPIEPASSSARSAMAAAKTKTGKKGR